MMDIKVDAPEFTGITAWINTKPLTMESLKGRVVLIDFWAYSCVNCLRTVPFIKRLNEKYARSGLVVIGIHSPEFSFEKDRANVEKAVKELGITYPVAMDSDLAMWREYANMYWPAQYIIGKDGYVEYVHFGEGEHSKTEAAVQEALGVKAGFEDEMYPTYMFDQSPETYVGFAKNSGLGSGLACDKDGCNVYVDPGTHDRDIVYPNGQWEQEAEYLELKKGPGLLAYKFNARQANVVAGPVGKAVEAQIMMDGKLKEKVKIDSYKMYTVHDEKKYSEHDLVIIFDGPVRVYAYTFE